jgi:hypothetical protein
VEVVIRFRAVAAVRRLEVPIPCLFADGDALGADFIPIGGPKPKIQRSFDPSKPTAIDQEGDQEVLDRRCVFRPAMV